MELGDIIDSFVWILGLGISMVYESITMAQKDGDYPALAKAFRKGL